jgi:hypothetical protein
MVLGIGSKSNKTNTRTKSSDDDEPSANDVDQLSMKNLETSEKSQFREFRDFLKTVVSFTGDLSSLTCPAFFLNGLSLLEYGYVIIYTLIHHWFFFNNLNLYYKSTYWGDHPSCFTAISQAQLPQGKYLYEKRGKNNDHSSPTKK